MKEGREIEEDFSMYIRKYPMFHLLSSQPAGVSDLDLHNCQSTLAARLIRDGGRHSPFRKDQCRHQNANNNLSSASPHSFLET